MRTIFWSCSILVPLYLSIDDPFFTVLFLSETQTLLIDGLFIINPNLLVTREIQNLSQKKYCDYFYLTYDKNIVGICNSL